MPTSACTEKDHEQLIPAQSLLPSVVLQTSVLPAMPHNPFLFQIQSFLMKKLFNHQKILFWTFSSLLYPFL